MDLTQRSFAAGEITPALMTRADLDRWKMGAETVKNMKVTRYGAATTRPGTKRIWTGTGRSGYTSYLRQFIPWRFNDDDYTLAVIDDRDSVNYRHAVYLLLLKNGEAISTSSAVAWNVATAYAIGDVVTYGGYYWVTTTAHTGTTPALSGTPWYRMRGAYREVVIGTIVSGSHSAFDQEGPCGYAQIGNDLVIVHRDSAPQKITANTDVSGNLTVAFLQTMSFGPSISNPTGLSITVPGGSPAGSVYYAVTAVDSKNNESTGALVNNGANQPDGTHYFDVNWTDVSGAVRYYVYKRLNGIYYYIGESSGSTFKDTNIDPDTSFSLLQSRTVASGNENPGVAGVFQQRLVLASTDGYPDRVWLSRTGSYADFTYTIPNLPDDSIEFDLWGKNKQEIKGILDLQRLVFLTSNGEFVAEGDSDGAIGPTTINVRQRGYVGSSDVLPTTVGESGLYATSDGRVRDLSYEWEGGGYKGRDLTAYAPHLFEETTIVDAFFQNGVDPAYWAVRSDGSLLCLSYVRDHSVWAWSQHHFDSDYGTLQAVGGDKDSVYLGFVTDDTANALTILRLDSDLLVDDGVLYDGTNTSGTTAKIQGASYDLDDVVTLTFSVAPSLTITDKRVRLSAVSGSAWVSVVVEYLAGSGTSYDVRIVSACSINQTTGVKTAASSVASALQNATTTLWGVQKETNGPYQVLEPTLTTADLGPLTLTGYAEASGAYSANATWIEKAYEGDAFTQQLRMLDLDAVEIEMAAKFKNVNQVVVHVKDSYPAAVGPDEDHLEVWRQRTNEALGEPTQPFTGPTDRIYLDSSWDSRGRILIQQDGPFRLTVCGVTRSAEVSDG